MEKNIQEILKEPLSFFAVFVPITLIFFSIAIYLMRTMNKRDKQFKEGQWGIAELLLSISVFLSLSFFAAILIQQFKFLTKNLFAILVINVILQLGTCTFIIFFLKIAKKYDKTNLGLRIPSGKEVSHTVGIYLTFLPMYYLSVISSYIILTKIGVQPKQQEIAVFFKTASGIQLWISIFCTALIIPILEEFFFRAFLYTWLRSILGITGAIAASAAIFAVVHGNYLGFLPIAILGMLFAFLYEKSQCIWLPILAHSLHNFLTIMLLLQGLE